MGNNQIAVTAGSAELTLSVEIILKIHKEGATEMQMEAGPHEYCVTI